MLNTKRKFNSHCVAQRTGSTGTTCNDIVDWVVTARPRLSILENVSSFVFKTKKKKAVENIDESVEEDVQLLSNIQALEKRLTDKNMVILHVLGNALCSGYPHTRNRFFLIAIPAEQFGLACPEFGLQSTYSDRVKACRPEFESVCSFHACSMRVV